MVFSVTGVMLSKHYYLNRKTQSIQNQPVKNTIAICMGKVITSKNAEPTPVSTAFVGVLLILRNTDRADP